MSSFVINLVVLIKGTRGLMTSLCHDYVSGTPTTSMTSWLRELFSNLTSFKLVLFLCVVLFSLVDLELNICV